LAILETSKVVVELVAEDAGILEILRDAGSEYAFGTVVGYLFDDEVQRDAFMAEQQKTKPTVPSESATLIVTRKARELMEEHSLTDGDLVPLGKQVIKRADVEALLSQHVVPPVKELMLSRRQQLIAETVSRSHTTIPKAFLLMRVRCDDVLAALKQVVHRELIMIGLPELLVQVTAGLAGRFPFFFGELVDTRRFVPANEPNIGVTFDVGNGLFIPVIKEARTKSLKQIAEELLSFRVKAFRGVFTQEDLSGSHITITLNTDRDVVMALPMILPTQSCMISLGAPQTELYLDAGQQITTRSYVHIGLSYDHRVINGHDAVQFLKAIKSIFEAPEQLV
jgi:2-oxoglutarate dehydrogenase E2 component (dihydrolipoamide succinyltransferase)